MLADQSEKTKIKESEGNTRYQVYVGTSYKSEKSQFEHIPFLNFGIP